MQMRLPFASARRTDPSTSHKAARDMELLGKAGSQRYIVYQAVVSHTGFTSYELAVAAGIDQEIPHRRLPELETMGLVKKMAPRTCRIRGTKCMTWWQTARMVTKD